MKVNARGAQRAVGHLRRRPGAPGLSAPPWRAMPLALRFLHEAFRHGKPIAIWPDAKVFLEAAGVPVSAEGISLAAGAKGLTEFVENIGQHRFPPSRVRAEPVLGPALGKDSQGRPALCHPASPPP